MNPDYRRLRFPFACLLLLAGVITIASQGCDKLIEPREMPAPLREPVEGTFTGELTKAWGGDNFEFLSGKETHYLLLRGVDSPDPGEPFYHQSKQTIKQLTNGKQLTVDVFDRDEVMHEIVDIAVPVGNTEGDFDSEEFDLGTELIKRGWARYNGAEFGEAERLIAAEASAKKRKVGIWADPEETPKKKSSDKK